MMTVGGSIRRQIASAALIDRNFMARPGLTVLTVTPLAQQVPRFL